jgi:ribosomal protein S18 acetylase RimI-like enzyme
MSHRSQLPRPDFSLRRATTSEAGALARLRYELRAELGVAQEPEATFLDRCARWMADRLQRQDWTCWVADAEGAVRGTLWIQFLEKLPNPVGEPEHHAYITSFYIQAAYRGGGVGSALLTAALEDCTARSVDSVFLWPTARSRSLYQRHGFSDRVGMMERHVPPA